MNGESIQLALSMVRHEKFYYAWLTLKSVAQNRVVSLN